MASGKTALHNFPIPKEEDVPDVAKDMDSLGEAIDTAIVVREEGTLAAKPVPGVKERIYYATDTKQYFIDSGSAWTAIGGPEVVEESNIKKEAVSTSKIKLLAIVEGLLADLSVGTKKIAESAVTAAKIALGVIADEHIVAGRALMETENAYSALVENATVTELEPNSSRPTLVTVRHNTSTTETLYVVGGVTVGGQTNGAAGVGRASFSFICPPKAKWKVEASGGGAVTHWYSYLTL